MLCAGGFEVARSATEARGRGEPPYRFFRVGHVRMGYECVEFKGAPPASQLRAIDAPSSFRGLGQGASEGRFLRKVCS
jgi:hypothetical protein